MNLTVRLAPPLRHWHHELVRELTEDGHRVNVLTADPENSARLAGVERMARLECRLHGLRRRLSRLQPETPRGNGTSADPVDLVVDLTNNPLSTERTWCLRVGERAGEMALVESLLQNRAPLVDLVENEDRVLARIRPGSESPGVLVSAWEDLLARCLSFVATSIQGKPFAAPLADNAAGGDQPPVPATSSLLRRGVSQAVGVGVRGVYRALYRAPHWRVGWRFVDGPGLIDRPDGSTTSWNDLPDDGLRFYADPFPFVHGDETVLFVEDFEHRVGKGVISVVRFDERGPLHAPVPVLRHDVHLSYPFVLEHDGEIWMIPETSAAGTVELYRATGFPETWQREATLITGAVVSDATLFTDQGLWWMMGTVQDRGAYSDALHCWYADRLTGPWHPHPHNPVLVDIASARPAGRVVAAGDRFLRPAQDCRTGYGGALTIAEITRLDKEGFEQRVLAELRPGTWWPGRRLHTLNRAGRLECIDGSAMAPRLPIGRISRKHR